METPKRLTKEWWEDEKKRQDNDKPGEFGRRLFQMVKESVDAERKLLPPQPKIPS